MTDTSILLEAHEIIHGERATAYGVEAAPPWQRVADMANALFGTHLTAADAATFLILVKLSRLATTPFHRDSLLDIAGYAGVVDKIGMEAKNESD